MIPHPPGGTRRSVGSAGRAGPFGTERVQVSPGHRVGHVLDLQHPGVVRVGHDRRHVVEPRPRTHRDRLTRERVVPSSRHIPRRTDRQLLPRQIHRRRTTRTAHQPLPGGRVHVLVRLQGLDRPVTVLVSRHARELTLGIPRQGLHRLTRHRTPRRVPRRVIRERRRPQGRGGRLRGHRRHRMRPHRRLPRHRARIRTRHIPAHSRGTVQHRAGAVTKHIVTVRLPVRRTPTQTRHRRRHRTVPARGSPRLSQALGPVIIETLLILGLPAKLGRILRRQQVPRVVVGVRQVLQLVQLIVLVPRLLRGRRPCQPAGPGLVVHRLLVGVRGAQVEIGHLAGGQVVRLGHIVAPVRAARESRGGVGAGHWGVVDAHPLLAQPAGRGDRLAPHTPILGVHVLVGVGPGRVAERFRQGHGLRRRQVLIGIPTERGRVLIGAVDPRARGQVPLGLGVKRPTGPHRAGDGVVTQRGLTPEGVVGVGQSLPARVGRRDDVADRVVGAGGVALVRVGGRDLPPT
ncbi:hypothetical protein ISCU110981_19865 [Isoptericola cucumis]